MPPRMPASFEHIRHDAFAAQLRQLANHTLTSSNIGSSDSNEHGKRQTMDSAGDPTSRHVKRVKSSSPWDSSAAQQPKRVSNSVEQAAKTWSQVLESMETPLLAFRRSLSDETPVLYTLNGTCSQRSDCRLSSPLIIRCLTDHRSVDITVRLCCAPGCEGIHSILLKNGFFPCSPSRPQTAISIQLLDSWRTIQESCTASVTGLAAALASHYTDEDDVGNPESSVEDPFRHQITEAIQWYSNLCARIEKRLNRVILENSMAPSGPNRGRAHDDLVQRCPACFNLNEWGRSGGDVHVGIDGNRTHKHNSNAGDGPTGHEPLFFLSRSLVDSEGKRIADVRLGHSTSYDPEIPDDVVNKCAKTYAAANEKIGKPISPKFDETGIFHLSCRHNIPLFVASMNTLGEEHKYFVTLLNELMARLPPRATVCLFSDVACIIERALRSYPLLPEDVVKRLRLSLNALHCRRHEHGCKMVLSPRLQTGLGLTDGEFVERLLSMLRNRITPTRSQWAERRIWTLEQQLDFIANKERSNLGRWLTRCRARTQQELDRATGVLRTCGISIPELRLEWDSRKVTAKNLDDHDDTDIEIEKLIDLQMAFEQLDKKLAQTMPHRHAANTVFKEMRVSLTGIQVRVDDIYNVEIAQRFPSLADTKLGFLKKMFMARDLKRTIRRLASISFSKWEALDQAKGGRGAPVGTTAAASLHRSIGQDAPQLMAALHKYNALCKELSETPRSSHDIQCPSSLPTKLSELREDPNLLLDISIHQGDQQNPDPTMQDKVEAMLTVDRCIEEHTRILQEGRNITDWVENRLSAISTAVSQQENMLFKVPLLRHQKHLRRLSEEWKDLVFSLSLPLEGILSNDASGFELAFIPPERKDRVPISELLVT
ncbi:hypothetical protein C8R47DRAFT_392513 [Mycena vitilis]|nr:hypothetical protein C8R47DRAFT_392513 [Mycena vitilis]